MTMTTPHDTQIFLDLIRLYSDYAAVVDSAQWESWVDFFVDEYEYKIQPRENYERGFPLATLALLNKTCSMIVSTAYMRRFTKTLIIIAIGWAYPSFGKTKMASSFRKRTMPYFAPSCRVSPPSLMWVVISTVSNATLPN